MSLSYPNPISPNIDLKILLARWFHPSSSPPFPLSS